MEVVDQATKSVAVQQQVDRNPPRNMGRDDRSQYHLFVQQSALGDPSFVVECNDPSHDGSTSHEQS